ncbi:MAG TPA: AAA family ATPase [Candidatus Deferrimicrobiaceae bacterium]|nr:AAA family ATPase [Candidatus Deferrimicrobiaceae bacterium]
MSHTLVGRDAELAAIRGFLDRPVTAARAIVIDGGAGIGKSTLWQVGVAEAQARFDTVLTSRPAQVELGLPYVVLGDLFGDVGSHVVAGLTPPRRRAFDAALLLAGDEGPAIDPRALGAALLDVLTALASDGPLVLAIDDDQWADASSIASLSFALRRLRGEPILMLLARRDQPGQAGLEAILDPPDVERLRVGPLSLGGLEALIQARLGISLPRPALLRVHEASGGNPLFAIEVARSQSKETLIDPLSPLQVPADLERLIGARYAGLPRETRDALLVAAAHGRPPVALLEELGVLPALEPALAAGVVERSNDVLRFSHPLLASVLYQGTSGGGRRAAHRRLAERLQDPVHRARHLALGTDHPDDAVAAELETSAGLARRRGAPIAAAELAELAERLTPDGDLDARQRRGMLAARAHLAAGAGDRAKAIAEARLATAAGPEARSEALILLAELETPPAAVALLEEALAGVAAAPRLAAEIHGLLADIGRFAHGRDWADQHARQALRLAEAVHDDRLRAGALSIAAVLRFERLEPGALELAQEAYRLSVGIDEPRTLRQARWAVGHLLTWMHRTDEARAWLERAIDEVADGDELSRSELLWYLSLVELWAGRWDRARAHAEAFMSTVAHYGVERSADHFAIGLIALHQGQLDIAREHARRSLEVSEHLLQSAGLELLGLAELWEGRPEAALSYFEKAADLDRERGLADPGQAIWWVDHVEALLQLGRIDEAETLVDDWEDKARRVGRDWALAQALRARGLVAAARGDLDDANRLLDGAIDAHARVGDLFGRARALLALGGVRLRQRRKRLAREAFEAALETFEALGAATWVARTRGELGRLGGRRRMDDLSPSERRVAELVAVGRTNREVAAALFLSERTVAGHLTRVYEKLGIRSRTELARHLVPADPDAATRNIQTS